MHPRRAAKSTKEIRPRAAASHRKLDIPSRRRRKERMVCFACSAEMRLSLSNVEFEKVGHILKGFDNKYNHEWEL